MYILWTSILPLKGRQIIRKKRTGRKKLAGNICKLTQTCIYRKKHVNCSVNSERHLKKLKTRHDAYLGPYLSIYVIKSPIQLVRQVLYIFPEHCSILKANCCCRKKRDVGGWLLIKPADIIIKTMHPPQCLIKRLTVNMN